MRNIGIRDVPYWDPNVFSRRAQLHLTPRRVFTSSAIRKLRSARARWSSDE